MIQTLKQDLFQSIGIGLLACLTTLGLALAIDPVVALALPFGILAGVTIVSRPIFGLLPLLFFAQLDGISDIVFAPSPISGFKLLSAATAFGILISLSYRREAVAERLQNPICVLALAFAAFWFLAVLLAHKKGPALQEGMRLFTIYLLVYFVMLSIFSEKHIKYALYCLMLTSLISGLVLILDVSLGLTLISSSDAATSARTAEGFDRSSGASQYNPTTAATMLLTGAVMALIMALESVSHRWLFGFVALIGAVAIVFSFARSSALVYGVIIFILGYRYRDRVFFGPAIVCGIIGCFAMIPFIPESYFDRIFSIFNGGGDWTLGRRLTYNLIGLDLLWRNPLGIGPGNFKVFFVEEAYRYYPGRTLYGRQLHNMYLSIAVEYGWLGFGVFVGLIGLAFKQVTETINSAVNIEMKVLATALFYGMLAYYMVSVFVPNEYNKYSWLLLGIAGAMGAVNRSALAGKANA